MKYNHTNLYFALLFSLVTLTGCLNDNFTILLPEQNQSYIDTLPDTLSISYKEAPPNKVVLNGVDITEHFQILDGVFVAQGVAVDGLFNQGNNVLSVEPNKFGPRHKFFVDTAGPKVSVSEVGRDGSVAIQGQLTDPSGVEGLTVNGVAAAVDEDGLFSVDVADNTTFHFVATDLGGRQSQSYYSVRSSIVDDAVKVRIDESAIHDILPVAQEAIAEMDINALLQGSGSSTLFRENVGIQLPKVVITPRVCTPRVCVFGVCTPEVCTPEVSVGPIDISLLEFEASLVDVDVREVNIDQLNINSGNHLVFGNWEGVSFDGEVLDAEFGIQIRSYVLGLTDISTTILNILGLNNLLDALDGNFTVHADVSRLRAAADVGISAVDGAVDATIVSINAVGLGGADSDFNMNIDLPDVFNLFGLGLAQAAVDVITAGIQGARDLIFDIVFSLLLPPVADLIVDSIISEIRVNVAAGISTGAQLAALFEVSTIDVVNNDNSLLLFLNGRVGAEAADVGGGDLNTGTDFGSPEVIWVSDHFLPDQQQIPENLGPAPDVADPALGFRYSPEATPDVANGGTEIAIVAAMNYLNQAMLGLYESGIIHTALPFAVSNTGLFLADENTATHRVLNEPKSPFELLVKGDQNKVLYLIVNHFHIITEEKVAEGEWNQLSDAELNAELPLTMEIVDGHLQLAFLTPSLSLGTSGGDGLQTDILAEYLLSTIVVEQLNLGLAQVPLPLIADITVGSETVSVNPQDLYLSGKSGIGITANTE